MVGGEDISIGADDDARAEALERLLALPLWKLAAEKFAQRFVRKRKWQIGLRHVLGGKHCYNGRRDLFDDGREARDRPLWRVLRFLSRTRKRAREDQQQRQQHARLRISPSHKMPSLLKESHAHARPVPFKREREAFIAHNRIELILR